MSKIRTSPSARSCKYLREHGFSVKKVEQVIPNTFIKRDVWGGDFLAMKPRWGTALVQVTAGGGSGKSNLYARYRKILGIPEARLWLECGNRFLLHGWKGAALTEIELTLADFENPKTVLP